MADLLERLNDALAGRYRLERELGSGGMATVYLAHDLKHERQVAIKVLRPELSESIGTDRFLHEIRIAANLGHPHILPLHDSGEADGFLFYVMPFVEGESLRDRLNREKQLPVADALKIATEVADALDLAHRRGVVHRDIKPENILLQEGHAVVADFGVARAISAAGEARLTETGIAIGTPAYLSPEQASGERELDGRSDVYALGCVLYEMLAGTPPFSGPSTESIVRQHLVVEPPSIAAVRPAVPAGVANAVTKALSKARADRFPSAAEFAAALAGAAPGTRTAQAVPRQSRRGRMAFAAVLVSVAVLTGIWAVRQFTETAPAVPRLAVLPLDNFTGDPDKDHVVQGLHEAVTLRLGSIEGLDVISRTSVMQYATDRPTVAEIVSSLDDVDAIIEGSVTAQDDSVRLSLQLIEAGSDSHTWTGEFDGHMRDVLQLYNDIALDVAAQLEVHLTARDESLLARARPVNPAAHDAYIRGRQAAAPGMTEGRARAIQFFRQAIELDSTFALAYGKMAEVYALIGVSGGHDTLSARQAYVEARKVALQALALDDALAEAHTALAEVSFHHDWDWEAADRHLRNSLNVNPSYATTHFRLSGHLVATGRPDEAEAAGRRGLALDPLTLNSHHRLALNRYWSHRYDEALEKLREILEANPDHASALRTLGEVHVQQREYDLAVDALERAVGRIRSITNISAMAAGYAAAGKTDEAMALLEELTAMARDRHVSPYQIARVHASLGQADEAMARLEQAAEEKDGSLIWVNADPLFTGLHDDPRFQGLLRRMNLAGE